MLNFNEQQKLIADIRTFAKEIGIVNRILTFEEAKEVIKAIKNIPVSERRIGIIQNIVTQTIGWTEFRIVEAFDYSDIDYVLDQIKALLDKKDS